MAKTRNKAYEELHKKLETKEENELFKITKQRKSKHVQQVRVIKSKTEEMLMKENVKQRWKEYLDILLNQENPRERKGRGKYLWKSQNWVEEDEEGKGART